MKVRFNDLPDAGGLLAFEFGVYTLLVCVFPRAWLWGYDDVEYDQIESWGAGPLFLLTRTPGRPLR